MRPPLSTVRATRSSHSGVFLPPRSVRVRADLDTPNRYLVDEDLSPRLEMVVVQEEAQERAVAGANIDLR
ncbi:hypothetical protein B0H14DRAFT_3427027 [Mycena olivaceomarginata]|nr:hypothetical protein B0H14DRAFT_3427027 [Mycena olivaceomarginata]